MIETSPRKEKNNRVSMDLRATGRHKVRNFQGTRQYSEGGPRKKLLASYTRQMHFRWKRIILVDGGWIPNLPRSEVAETFLTGQQSKKGEDLRVQGRGEENHRTFGGEDDAYERRKAGGRKNLSDSDGGEGWRFFSTEGRKVCNSLN